MTTKNKTKSGAEILHKLMPGEHESNRVQSSSEYQRKKTSESKPRKRESKKM